MKPKGLVFTHPSDNRCFVQDGEDKKRENVMVLGVGGGGGEDRDHPHRRVGLWRPADIRMGMIYYFGVLCGIWLPSQSLALVALVGGNATTRDYSRIEVSCYLPCMGKVEKTGSGRERRGGGGIAAVMTHCEAMHARKTRDAGKTFPKN